MSPTETPETAAIAQQTYLKIKAENNRLRLALEAIVMRSHNDPLGTSKVVDMRSIAEVALTNNGEKE